MKKTEIEQPLTAAQQVLWNEFIRLPDEFIVVYDPVLEPAYNRYLRDMSAAKTRRDLCGVHAEWLAAFTARLPVYKNNFQLVEQMLQRWCYFCQAEMKKFDRNTKIAR